MRSSIIRINISLFVILISFNFHGTAQIISFPDNFKNLQEAIDFASDHDTILVSDGVYSGFGNRNINPKGKNLVIISKNGPSKTKFKLNNHRGFLFHSGEDSTFILDGFTIFGGDAGPEADFTIPKLSTNGGGISIFQSSPTIRNCIIEKNTGFYGSGIHVTQSSSKIINCVVRNNRNFWGAGGGISVNSDSTIWTNCLISENETGWGAGIFLSGSNATFVNCTIINNQAIAEKSARNITTWYKNSPTFIRCVIWGGEKNQISTSPFEEESNLNCTVTQSIIEGGYDGKENYDTAPKFVNKISYGLNDDVYSKLNINYPIGADIHYLSYEIQKDKTDYTFYYLIASHVLFGVVVFFITKYSETYLRKKKTEIQQYSKPKTEMPKNSIFLFGSFEILNKEGINVSNQFSDIAKELFLRLLIKNNNHGLTVDEIHSSVWGTEIGLNKNPIQVALSKLKKLLHDSKLPISIKKEGLSYSLEFGEEFYCDYFQFKTIASTAPNESDIPGWIEITSKGELMKGISYTWLDEKKAEVETKIISQSKRFFEIANDDQKKKLLKILKMYEE